jgi:Tfp pilus assembly protein PilX
MSTTNSRIGAYVANAVPDNTYRTVNRSYITYANATGVTYSQGTQTVTPTAEQSVFNFTTALTGALTLNCNATSSTFPSYINDKIEVFFLGGSATYSVTYGTGLVGAAATVAIAPNKYAHISGTFNGTYFICDSVTTV